MELWKNIDNFPNYQISNYGRVKNIDGRILKPSKDKNGYLMVNMLTNTGYKTKRIHRLVAEAFIPNLNNYKEVNHIDENKENNCFSNLEWCSHKYNSNYGTRNKRISNNMNKKIGQYDMNNNLVKIYESIKEANRQTGISNAGISYSANNIRKNAGGYIWHFIEKDTI